MTWVRVPEQSDGDVWTVQLWRTIQEDLNEGVMRPLADTTVGVGGVASIDFQSISQEYDTLVLVALLRGEAAAGAVGLSVRLNNDTGSNYDSQRRYANNTTLTQDEFLAQTSMLTNGFPGSTAPANHFSAQTLIIPGYASTAFRKAILTQSHYKSANTSGNHIMGDSTGFWRSTAAVTRVTLVSASGDFAELSRATLYGVA